jgi:peptide/nickel transport system permease protein
VRYVGRRVIQLVVVIVAVTFLSTLLLSLLPGDAAVAVCGFSCSPDQVQELRVQMGLDKPIVQRYVTWMDNAAHGDLGQSNLTHVPVTESLKENMPVTLFLLVASQLVALAIAVPAGIVAGRRPNGVFDKGSTLVSFVFLAVPSFVVALLLVDLFAVNLHWLPSIYKTETTADTMKSLILPVITLAVAEVAVYSRLLRTDLMATMQEDYITMARAKGLSSRRILWRHAFKPSTFSLLTAVGLRFGALIGGTFIVEYVFSINGVGLYSINAIRQRDLAPLLGTVFVIAVGYVLINFVIDMLYAVLDPRIRHARAVA